MCPGIRGRDRQGVKASEGVLQAGPLCAEVQESSLLGTARVGPPGTLFKL